MEKYVALLRGINPLNRNMQNEKLRVIFKKLGFKNVQTVLSSGNVIFGSRSKNTRTLECTIEKTLLKGLGFQSTTIVRSAQQILRLIKSNPFQGKRDTPTSHFNITFLKKGGEVFSIIDTIGAKTSPIMAGIEKKYGKEITTRTWKTVSRISAKLNTCRRTCKSHFME